MSENDIVKRSVKELKPGSSDWPALDAMTDEQIDRQIAADPDAASILDEEWFKNATVYIPAKAATSMRIDSDVMEWFRSEGRGWQTRMNAVLRAYARAHGGVK